MDHCRVFIGTNQKLHAKAELVIEHSIHKNASRPVEINFIRPCWQSGCTTFTNHRYHVPELTDYSGFAIYMDVDMLVLGDVYELWEYQQKGKWVTTPMRDDVSVIDCRAFEDLTDEIVRTKHKSEIQKQIGSRYEVGIPIAWNTIDTIDQDTKLIHYSDLSTQPWRPNPKETYYQHPNKEICDLFFEYLKEVE